MAWKKSSHRFPKFRIGGSTTFTKTVKLRQPPMPVRQPPMPVRQPPMPVRQPPMPVRQPPMPAWFWVTSLIDHFYGKRKTGHFSTSIDAIPLILRTCTFRDGRMKKTKGRTYVRVVIYVNQLYEKIESKEKSYLFS